MVTFIGKATAKLDDKGRMVFPSLFKSAMPEGEDGLIVRAVDALFDHHHIPPALEADLAAAIGRPAVFDLIATFGF